LESLAKGKREDSRVPGKRVFQSDESDYGKKGWDGGGKERQRDSPNRGGGAGGIEMGCWVYYQEEERHKKGRTS